jgi:hypothetical protein
VVRDTYGFCASLSPIYLTDPSGNGTLVDPGFNLGCDRPTGDQGVVHDFTFTIPSAGPNTNPGTNVQVQSNAGDSAVTFSQVTGAGTTSFTPIDPAAAGTVPSGYTLCPNCPAYDISTTAAYTPPVTVCIDVPAGIDTATFNALSLLHGENGALVDVTTSHVTNTDGTREVCGQVSSLSPFALAQAPPSNSSPALSNIAASSPIVENGSTSLAGTISDPDAADTFTLTVNWGDGSNPEAFNYPAGTTSFNETHQYKDDDPTGTSSDTYTISLTLKDNGDASDTDSVSVTVDNAAPTLSNIQLSASTINAGGSVTLSGTVADTGTLDTHTVQIDWGDGSGAESVNMSAGVTSFNRSHTYNASGPYTIGITASDDDGGSDSDSTNLTVNPAPSAPNAPSNLTGQAASKTQINLSWTDNSNNEDGFLVERCAGTKKCKVFAQIAQVGSNVVSITDSGLAGNTSYVYRIRAYNSVGNSAYSNSVTVKTLRK